MTFDYRRPQQVRFRPALLRLGALYRAPIHYQHDPAEIVRQLRLIRPGMVGGYPAILAEIAAYLDDNDRAQLPLKFVVAGGDTLTGAARREIESGFGARVFNFYGMNEVVLAASECPHTGLFHLSSETVIAEVLCGDRPAEVGETGEITVTSLHSYAMPFIRYQPGDLVERGPDPLPLRRALPHTGRGSRPGRGSVRPARRLEDAPVRNRRTAQRLRRRHAPLSNRPDTAGRH